MKQVFLLLLAFTLVVSMSGAGNAGKIVVNHDEWTFDDAGFSQAPDAEEFILNILDWFTRGTYGNFLSDSKSHGLVGSTLAGVVTGAGHSWTVSTTVDTSLNSLLEYDGIFFAGSILDVDEDVLREYVEAGGNVYIAAGTTWTAGHNADQCNPFLNQFGLNLAREINGVVGTPSTTSSHPIFDGVGSLYYVNGNFVSKLDPPNPHTEILEYWSQESNGMIAIYDNAFPTDEIIGNWPSGIFYRDVAGSSWTRMTDSGYYTDGDIAAGDFTGDKKADVASCWDSGLWYQNGDTLGWTKVWDLAPSRVTAGDITGDGRAEIIGTWSDGVYYWNAITQTRTIMTSWVTTGDIAAGDITGDGKADVASCWPGYGLYYQNGATFGWQLITTYIPANVAVGDLTGDGKAEVIGTFANGIWYWNPATGSWKRLTGSGYVTDGDIATGDFTGDGYADTVSCWSDGLWMVDGKTGAWTQVYDTAPYRVTAGDITGN